jgi:hypothetical protein
MTLLFFYGTPDVIPVPFVGWVGVPPYFGLGALRDWYTGAGNLREGNRQANELFGTNVSEPNARWLTTEAGRTFARSLVVAGGRIVPNTIDDLRAMLLSEERGEVWLDRAHINDALSDGRAMSDALPDLNARLSTALSGEGDARTTARTELGTRLGRLGITPEDVREALIREKESRSPTRTISDAERARIQALELPEMLGEFVALRGRSALELADMKSLRLADWRRRGVVIDSRRGAVETFLREQAGMSGTELDSAVAFFTRRENAFKAISGFGSST